MNEFFIDCGGFKWLAPEHVDRTNWFDMRTKFDGVTGLGLFQSEHIRVLVTMDIQSIELFGGYTNVRSLKTRELPRYALAISDEFHMITELNDFFEEHRLNIRVKIKRQNGQA